MKARIGLNSSCLFLIAIALLLIRPVVVYSSNIFRSSLISVEKKDGASQGLIKKRKETFRHRNIVSKEIESIITDNVSLVFFLLASKKLLASLFILFAFLSAETARRQKRKTTFFKIIPAHRHYLALSIIRI